MSTQSANDSSITSQNDQNKAKLKLVDFTIRLRNEFNLCMIPSGKLRDGKYKSPWITWANFNLPGAELPTVEQIKFWNNQYHPTLWGFVTGKISGITVFDADSPEAIQIFFNAGLLPHVVTARGQHYYFEYPGEQYDHLIKTTSGVIPHVDIRAAGGFVNCTGRNPTASYKMVKSPKELYYMEQLPPEVIEGIGKLQSKPIQSQFDNIGEIIPDGIQNHWLYKRACGYRNKGDSEAVIFEKLKLDISRCPQTPGKPPFTETTLRSIAKSASKHTPGQITDSYESWMKTSGRY